MFDIIIIGAGPAGLFTASSLSSTGKKILILEKNASPGKKLLLSGSGQCNITHTGETSSFFTKYGPKSNFIKSAIKNFSNKDLVQFLETNGLPVFEREDGKIFPQSLNSKDLLNLLISKCSSENINIIYNEPVIDIDYTDNEFMVKSEKNKYKSEILIISTGGRSYPKTGSTGDGYSFAEKFGHSVIHPRPALVPIKIKDFLFSELSGISLSGINLKLTRNGRVISQSTGDVLFTHRNISGPVVLNISRYVEKNDYLYINFINNNSISSLNDFILNESKSNGKRSIKSILKNISLPSRLIDLILNISEINPEIKCAELSKEKRKILIENFTFLKMEIEGTENFDIAMVTAGGINTEEINRKTMESKLIPRLYFTGEVLDIDGDSGGYNIQAAISTGKLAADSIKLL